MKRRTYKSRNWHKTHFQFICLSKWPFQIGFYCFLFALFFSDTEFEVLCCRCWQCGSLIAWWPCCCRCCHLMILPLSHCQLSLVRRATKYDYSPMWKELWTEYFCSQWNITTEQKSDCMWSRNPGPETIRPFAYITTKSKTIVVKLFCYVSFFLHLVSVVVHFSKNAFCWMRCLECLDLKRIMFGIHWACVCIMKAALLTAYAFDHLCVPGALLLLLL